MVNHFLSTNPYKLSIFERSITCRSFRELYSSADKISGEKVLRMYLSSKQQISELLNAWIQQNIDSAQN